MVFTVFDIFMARSLRSLAGVLYGEYGKTGAGEEHLYNYSDIHIQTFITILFVAKFIKW